MKLGIFQNNNGEWIVGKDVQNGACCETKEIAEQLLALHNKYHGKTVSFDLGNGTIVEGKVTEVGVNYPDLDNNLYIRYKSGLYKRAEDECTVVKSSKKQFVLYFKSKAVADNCGYFYRNRTEGFSSVPTLERARKFKSETEVIAVKADLVSREGAWYAFEIKEI